MSQLSVKIPYAERDGGLIHVSRVERGLACRCVCPVCGEPVIARKGTVLRHHFAHHSRGECSPETVLHHVGKRLLYNRLSRHLSQGRPLPLRWTCRYCGEIHEGNLLKRAGRVKMEQDLGRCRPDVALLGEGGDPVAVVEVVVTHAPEEGVVDYCEDQGIPLVQFRLKSVRDLLSLECEKPLRPDYVDLCLRPQCGRCGEPLSPATLHVVDIPCWRCGFDMKAALVNADGQVMGPEVLSREQIEMVEALDVLIRVHHSQRSGRRYRANTCPTCGAFVGASYLRYYSQAVRSRKGREIGGVCLSCRDG